MLESAKILSETKPSYEKKLRRILDSLFIHLSYVQHSPPIAMQKMIAPLEKTLLEEIFFNHSDLDVRVGVAACINEIIGIYAFNPPFDDEQMKIRMLENMACLESWVLMLRLECDELVVEMFHKFLKSIRDIAAGPTLQQESEAIVTK
ncbi:unnamed protein product [Arabis nemorensis]|uniref:Uncharacterized protein n=1 Tax=Arabis nemorensis TaxID=586526 RepID=A0A565CC51_9BRAS|nr:unnamed protein product [Arabis nemorensis]